MLANPAEASTLGPSFLQYRSGINVPTCAEFWKPVAQFRV
ncbi:uncharacterized protein METZ01_LOCUS35561 [marine metagenome]|uniref:Uncharacterized protein n=1 Tax=marine metagenome TaxID=408172 RepID=A0A381QYD1_9ZZZZ